MLEAVTIDCPYCGESFFTQIDVSGGTLVLDGSAGFRQTINYGTETKVVRSSNVLVQGPGVLAGNGTVGDTYVVDGGTLSPGHGDVGTQIGRAHV